MEPGWGAPSWERLERNNSAPSRPSLRSRQHGGSFHAFPSWRTRGREAETDGGLTPDARLSATNWCERALTAGEARRAAEAFRQAIRGDPKNSRLYLGAGVAAWLERRDEEAKTALERALALEPALDRWPVAIALLIVAVALVPSRVKFAATLHRMPEYAAIVAASRTMVGRGQPLRGIETSFPLPPTSDPEFVYCILRGPIDPASPWIGVVERGLQAGRRLVSRLA
jgi:tetratricopeptide (TPR) repeat protein